MLITRVQSGADQALRNTDWYQAMYVSPWWLHSKWPRSASPMGRDAISTLMRFEMASLAGSEQYSGRLAALKTHNSVWRGRNSPPVAR